MLKQYCSTVVPNSYMCLLCYKMIMYTEFDRLYMIHKIHYPKWQLSTMVIVQGGSCPGWQLSKWLLS